MEAVQLEKKPSVYLNLRRCSQFKLPQNLKDLITTFNKHNHPIACVLLQFYSEEAEVQRQGVSLSQLHGW